jgi:ABC-type branched-subunit amino acid transport system ATPase component
MLAIGRVLMQAPKIILFDEPTAGLSPEICERVFLGIKSLTDRGIASVMVEHRISEALAISDRCLQMKDGRVSSLWRSNKFGSLTTISFAQRRGSDEKER